MSSAKKTIMIPWDFSPAADNAFLHGMLLKRGYVDFTLVHIVDNESKVAPKKEELTKVAEELAAKNNIEKPNVVVRKGNIFKHVSQMATDLNALLVVMGVHNIQNKRALKVVTGSKVPFVLVQGPPKHNTYKEIVVPFDEDEKNRVQLNWVINLAKYYECNIDIIKPFFSKDSKNERMRNQLFFIKKNLDAKGIIFGVRTSKRGTEFSEAIFQFTEEIDADMLMMMSFKFKHYIKGMKEHKPPIMVINPKLAKLAGFN
ncbi:MAG: universal stress protein [Bacteroidota bacterium]